MEKKKSITIFEYANHFGLIWVNGDVEAMNRPITSKSVNRPGLELAGYFDYPISTRLILLGNKECSYINKMKPKDLEASLDFLMDEKSPGLVVCGQDTIHPTILKLAKKKNFPVFSSTRKTSELLIDSVMYLDEALSPSTSIHGTLVDIFSTGVVLMGGSGIGKSETALELIKRGHHLVSDDRVDINYIRGKLIGKAPSLLVNMMEVRGIGIIDVSKMFGVNTVIPSKSIELVIKLVHLEDDNEIERLGTTSKYKEILNQRVPLITIPVTGARSVSEIVEVAVTNFKLKKSGYDSTYQFEERMNELLRKGDK